MFQCVPPIISGSEWGWVLSLFLAGLTGGFMHCVLMCGPFVLAAQKNQLGRVASVLLLPYHLGRLVTYSLLGVLANFFLNAAFFASPLRDLVSAVFLGLAGLLFLAQAFPSLYKFLPFLTQIKVPLPSRWIEYAARPFLTTERGEGDSPLKFSILSNWRLFGLGILLGFLPCGFLMGALLAAAAAPSLWLAALGMSGFALGTIPSLVVVALGGRSLATLYPTPMRVLSQVVFVLNGCILFVLAGRLLI
jgi:sulfite exporter TauE/SafE